MEIKEMKKIVEALLFVSHEPVALEKICEVMQKNETSVIREAVRELQTEYESSDRGMRISDIAGGFQMSTKPELSAWIEKLHQVEKRVKLSRPALETLAIIAYRQPIVRSDIEGVRGVGVEHVIKTLLERGLVRIAGRKKAPGSPLLYGTGSEFLRFFGLKSLAELPKIEQFAQDSEGRRGGVHINEPEGIQKEDR